MGDRAFQPVGVCTEEGAMGETYAKAGVDIDVGEAVTKAIARHARTTYRPEVLSGVGLFGG